MEYVSSLLHSLSAMLSFVDISTLRDRTSGLLIVHVSVVSMHTVSNNAIPSPRSFHFVVFYTDLGRSFQNPPIVQPPSATMTYHRQSACQRFTNTSGHPQTHLVRHVAIGRKKQDNVRHFVGLAQPPDRYFTLEGRCESISTLLSVNYGTLYLRGPQASDSTSCWFLHSRR